MKTYRNVIRFLKKTFPAYLKVSVRRLALSEHLDGDCQLKTDKFQIRINRDLQEHEAIETLLHEWAHVIAWDRCPTDEHCDEWGKAYSRIYRAFLKEFLDKSA